MNTGIMALKTISADYVQLLSFNDILQAQMKSFSIEFDGFDPIQGKEIMNGESELSFPSPSVKSSEDSINTTTSQSLLILPGEETEQNSQSNIHHLLMACGEAIEMDQRKLVEVIMRCLRERVNPAGGALERLAFKLCKDIDKEEELDKNLDVGLEAFYQIFPYGRFAHFAANSTIITAMPENVMTVHIVDFDLGEGMQWPPIIEAMAYYNKKLKLTAIKWEKEEEKDDDSSCVTRFEDTKRRLNEYARSFGVLLQVEEIKVEDLVIEVKKLRKRDCRSEWFAFNCMVGLPHMRRVRDIKNVEKFLKIAKESMAGSINYNPKNREILLFGDGYSYEKLKHCSSFSTFFNGNIEHYKALLQSMESSFPVYFTEGRIAMESLFVEPYVSIRDWLRKWKELREGYSVEIGNSGLCGRRLSNETLVEIMEMMLSVNSLYEVSVEGENENEIILEWKGTPLVKVSIWRNQF